ncbi:LDL receptor domain-containing protein [Endozoicomonas sp. SCSIO W0465]|uniref:LDL receptor domain-containing protein n=1 Tax=Endozoicomonas sp. SCSIO W0465 TaxID=2918516 RepID=UPI002076540E|nr:LDL receptor domain-containing protein [Endozoicomonas sp. SCSIO W0465]USE37347.1 LDL receptor domain-containing protein [Endozoicomonas sp. SCSIO W0465]
MLVTTSAVPNDFPFQSGASSSAKTSNGTGIAVCQAHTRCHHDSVQQPEHKAISDYRVRQLAGDALQTGRKLVRSAVHFAFSQVMSSPYIGAVAPGLKETLLGLAVLYSQQQPTLAACASGQFQCNNNICINPGWQCDGDIQCFDSSDEQGCTQDKCKELGRFICDNNKCINPELQCDGDNNCGDNSDEQGCTQEKCEALGRFICDNKECINLSLQCDDYDDCGDNSDEQGCTKDKCEELGRFICDNKECIDSEWQCDGDKDCSDNSDEQGCTQDKCERLGRDFHCANDICIDTGLQCNGFNDCYDSSDEDGCTQDKCEMLGRDFHCDNNQCIDPKGLCNGYDDCHDSSDEQMVLCSPVTSSSSNSSSNPATSPILNATDTGLEASAEPSPYAWLALPAVLAAGAAAAYGVCTYKSYKTLRQGNPNAPTTPLLLNALRHPLQFRQSHHQPEAAMELHTLSGSAKRAVALQNV